MVFCNMMDEIREKEREVGHNPYFNKWFSAIIKRLRRNAEYHSHNPYFNRWFSAIIFFQEFNNTMIMSQSLF